MSNFDAVTLATIAGPILVVAGWALGYLVRARKRLLIEVYEPTLVNPDIQGRDMRLLVEHRGVTLDNPVFMQSVRLWNVGNRDILLDPAHDSADILTKNGASILSANAMVSSQFMLTPVDQKDPNRFSATWKMMKPKEWANIHFVLSVPHESMPLHNDGFLQPIFRVQDVKLVYDSELNRRRSVFWTGTIIAAVVTVTLYSVNFFFLPFGRLPAYQTSAGKYEVLRDFEGTSAQLCTLEGNPFMASSCRSVTLAEVQNLGEPIERRGHTRKNPIIGLIYSVAMLLVVLGMTNLDYARMEYRAMTNGRLRRQEQSPFANS